MRNAVVDLLLSLEALASAQDVSVFSPPYAVLLDTARERFKGMVNAIGQVHRKITPEFFTTQLRPYFEPKEVDGKRYLSPGGAQMPILLIDLILWGSDCEDSIYQRYWAENIAYQPLFLRQRGKSIMAQPSLMRHALRAFERLKSSVTAEELEIFKRSVSSLEGMLLILEKFRHQHLRVAEANMLIRPDGSVGSGGYDTEILELLIRKVREARELIARLRSCL